LLIYFYYKEHQNVQAMPLSSLDVVLADQTVNLAKNFT